jgi:uncharacterized protein Veg
MKRKRVSPAEVLESINMIDSIRETIQGLKGEEVIVRYGKGKRRRREVQGKIGETFKKIFILEYEVEDEKLTEAFRYQDLQMETSSIELADNGNKILTANQA